MDGALAPVSGLKCAVCAGPPLEMPAAAGGLPEARQWPILQPASDFGRAD
jgi:hypothetical protein